MKDSRIGPYSTLVVVFGVALRVTALAEMPLWSGAAALISAHAAARITPAFVMNALPYAGDKAAMKVSYTVSANDVRVALIVVVWALVPLAFVSIPSVISGLLLGAVLATAIAFWARRLIDGYTGDVAQSSRCSRSASCSASRPLSDRPFQRQLIRLTFARLSAAADPIDRLDHPAIALEQIIRKPDHQPVGGGGWRPPAQFCGDVAFESGIAIAGNGKRSRAGTADPGPAMMVWTAPTQHRCARLGSLELEERGAVHGSDYTHWYGYVEAVLPASRGNRH